MNRLKRLLREPVLHFLLVGAGLFLAFSVIGSGGDGPVRTITVTRGQIEALVTGFTGTWQRPPTEEELTGLIQEHIREEVYAREAKRLGLDKDDTIIRRRLRQKMEFLTDDIATQAEPTDDDLKAWLKEHPDSFGEAAQSGSGFEDLSSAIKREWIAAKRLEVNEKVYQEMLSHYVVSIERPATGGAN